MSISKKKLEASQHRAEGQEGNFVGWVMLTKVQECKRKRKRKRKRKEKSPKSSSNRGPKNRTQMVSDSDWVGPKDKDSNMCPL